jgi:hypothetical protein
MAPIALLFVMVLMPATAAGATPSGSTTIYRAVLPDGTVFIGDQRPTTTATVQVLSYPVPQGGQVDARAEAQRRYWREQAEAFEERRREREREAAARRQVQVLVEVVADARRPVAEPTVGFTPILPAWRGPAVVVPVAPAYTSSPGAIRGRQPGFIGSGFAVSR